MVWACHGATGTELQTKVCKDFTITEKALSRGLLRDYEPSDGPFRRTSVGAVAAYYSYLYIYSAISRYLLRDVTRYCNYLSNTLDSAAGMRADEPRPRTTHALPSAQAHCPATTLRPAYFYKQTVLCLHRSFCLRSRPIYLNVVS